MKTLSELTQLFNSVLWPTSSGSPEISISLEDNDLCLDIREIKKETLEEFVITFGKLANLSITLPYVGTKEQFEQRFEQFKKEICYLMRVFNCDETLIATFEQVSKSIFKIHSVSKQPLDSHIEASFHEPSSPSMYEEMSLLLGRRVSVDLPPTIGSDGILLELPGLPLVLCEGEPRRIFRKVENALIPLEAPMRGDSTDFWSTWDICLEERLLTATCTSLQLKNKPYIVHLEKGTWLDFSNKTEKPKDAQGWKLHVSVDYNDLGKALLVLLEYGFQTFKIIDFTQQSSLLRNPVQRTKPITIYINHENNKSIQQLLKDILGITHEFLSQGIQPGEPLIEESAYIPGTSGFFFIRNDLACCLTVDSVSNVFVDMTNIHAVMGQQTSPPQKGRAILCLARVYCFTDPDNFELMFKESKTDKKLPSHIQPLADRPLYNPGGYFPLCSVAGKSTALTASLRSDWMSAMGTGWMPHAAKGIQTQKAAVARLLSSENPAVDQTDVYALLCNARTIQLIGIPDPNYWYDHNDINKLLLRFLQGDTHRAIVFGACAPFHSPESREQFKHCLLTASAGALPSVIPVNNFIGAGEALSSAEIFGTHWIGVAVLPGSPPTLLYMDPLGHFDGEDICISSTANFDISTLSSFSAFTGKDAHRERIHRLLTLLKEDPILDFNLVITGQKQQDDDCSCGPLCVENLVNVALAGSYASPLAPPNPRVLREKHAKLLSSGQSLSPSPAPEGHSQRVPTPPSSSSSPMAISPSIASEESPPSTPSSLSS